MKKITSKQVLTCVILLGITLLACVYFLVFKKYTEDTESLKKQNTELKQRVETLKDYFENKETYEADMESMKADIRDWMKEFPADTREEDMLRMALDTMEVSNVNYTNVNIGDKSALSTVSFDLASPVGMEEFTSDVILVERIASYVNTVDYGNLKELISEINKKGQRRIINNFSYSRDEENNYLDGTIEVTFYSLNGTTKEYVPAKFDDYKAGLTDLFKITKKEKTAVKEEPVETEEQ